MTKLILHLGAHRTGSTHVQGVMGDNKALLAKAGIAAPAQPLVKNAFTRPIGARLPKLNGGFNRMMADHGLPQAETVVISDENLLGFLNSIFTHGLFYPDTARRLGRLKSMLPFTPCKIVIAVRPYESYFASAYGRWLGPGRMVIPRDLLAGTVLAIKRGWDDVLLEVAAAFPEAEMVVNEYSPAAEFGAAQLAAILGPVANDLVVDTGYRWNRSMSARQTMLYERALLEGDMEKAAVIRTWLRFKQPKLVDNFWDEATRAALQQRYEADRAVLIERFPAFVTAAAFEGRDAG